MVKKNPEMIWMIKQIPRSDPKFHQIEIFNGVGKVIKDELMIWRIVLFFIKDFFIINFS